MTHQVKIAGVWRQATPHIKVGGVWKTPLSGWAKVAGVWKNTFMAGGVYDSAFSANFAGTNGGAGGSVNGGAIQPDGKVILVGSFTTWNGVTVNGIVRLNTDGTRDTAFNTNTGTGTGAVAGTYVTSVAIGSDGGIVLVGTMSQWNGVAVNKIVKLSSAGVHDTTFTTNMGTGPNNNPYRVKIQSDLKILVVGIFTLWNGLTASRIIRLNANGTRDTAFMTNVGTAANNYVYAVTVQSDGKILVGGEGNIWNGVTRNRIVRLNADGTLDTAFSALTGTTADAYIWDMQVQDDGKIIVCGQCLVWNGTTVNQVFRLLSTGALDTAFTTNVGVGGNNQTVFQAKPTSQGQIVLGTNATTWKGVTLTAPYTVLLNPDGTRDLGYTTNQGTGFAGAVPTHIFVMANDKILLAGGFTSWNGIVAKLALRLGGDRAT